MLHQRHIIKFDGDEKLARSVKGRGSCTGLFFSVSKPIHSMGKVVHQIHPYLLKLLLRSTSIVFWL